MKKNYDKCQKMLIKSIQGSKNVRVVTPYKPTNYGGVVVMSKDVACKIKIMTIVMQQMLQLRVQLHNLLK